MQSRNCPKCGKTMTFEAGNEPTFCSNCGERLNGQRDAEIIAPDNLLTSQMVTEEEKQILLKKLEIETKRTGFIERNKKDSRDLWNNSVSCCYGSTNCDKQGAAGLWNGTDCFYNKHILADFGNTFVFCTTQRLWLDGSTSSEKIQKVIICYC